MSRREHDVYLVVMDAPGGGAGLSLREGWEETLRLNK